MVVVALGVFKALQNSAFGSIQLAATLDAVAQRGRLVVDGVYPDDALEPPAAAAERMDAVIELCVRPGEVSPERGRVAVVDGAGDVSADGLLPARRTGIERTFDQDPAMALRVLAGIALRALSPAVNDPTTAVQALDGIDQLLRWLVRRDLAVDAAKGSDGEPRVLLRLASREDYVCVALDEIIEVARSSSLVQRRIERLLTELVAIGPASRAGARQARLERAEAAPA